MVNPGDFYYCPKSGTIVVVVRGGDAKLSTEHGAMVAKNLDVAEETLEVIDADLDDIAGGRDRGPRMARPVRFSELSSTDLKTTLENAVRVADTLRKSISDATAAMDKIDPNVKPSTDS